MITIVKGNLLKATETIIVHQCNCMGSMGAGIAKEIKSTYPIAFKKYKYACDNFNSNDLLGKVQMVRVDENRIVCNMYSQREYGRGKQFTNLDAMESCFNKIKSYAIKYNLTVAMPYKIGSALGGANWEDVYAIIKRVFKDMNIVLYSISGEGVEEDIQVEKITKFRNQYNFLSNFYNAPITYDGVRYLSSEVAFQAQKATGKERNLFIGIDGKEAKALGKQISLRPDWDEVKYDIMLDIVRTKFNQYPSISTKLVATGNAELIEENYWNDTYWGVCRGSGENNLGKILMQVRQEIKGE